MRRIIVVPVLLFLLLGGLRALPAGQEAQEKTPPDTPTPGETLQSAPSLYTSVGRRDPFKDLLSGTDLGEKSEGGQGPQVAIDDLILIGIVRAKGKLLALVTTGPQGFPHKIQPGDKFADGYVVSIGESSVTFRKTTDRGVRLPKPRDVIKEISQEER